MEIILGRIGTSSSSSAVGGRDVIFKMVSLPPCKRKPPNEGSHDITYLESMDFQRSLEWQEHHKLVVCVRLNPILTLPFGSLSFCQACWLARIKQNPNAAKFAI